MLFQSLLKKYGPQHWWPAKTEYEVIVGAVLTQNCAWKNVEKAIKNLKNAGVLSPKKVLMLPMKKLKQLIKPAGFYNQKAKRLKLVTKKYLKLKPKIAYLSTEEIRKELLSINGVGNETADSILLYAFNRPVFVVDAYTKIFCRYFNLCKCKTYEGYQHFFHSQLPKNTYLFNEYHALIVEWAKKNKQALKTFGRK
ncbi:MAG: endonuclease III domain-containing protein [Candidatus Anstonellales archaeon]